MEKVLIEGSVDPKLIRDLKDVADGLKRTSEEADKLRTMRSDGIEQMESRLDRLGRAAHAFNEVAEFAQRAGGAVLNATRAVIQSAAAHETQQRALQGLRGGYDEIARATNGTINATAAYRAQQTLLNSGLRVSGGELATIARHAREHRDVTKSAEEAVQELTEALRGGEAEGLRKYGIAVQEGATRAQTFEAALRRMRREAAGVGPAARTMAEDVHRFEESLTQGGNGLGALVEHATGARSAMNELGESIRTVSSDIAELIERENQLPQQRAQQQARTRATDDYLTAQRGLRNALQSAGFSESEARGMIPRTALGSLTPEQLQTQARRLAEVRASLGALASPQFDGIAAGADSTAGTNLAGVAQMGGARVGALGTVDTRAALAGLRAARGGRPNAAREQIRTLLTGLGREMAGDAEANFAAATQRARGPRDAAAAASAQSGPTALDAQLAQVEADLATMEALTADDRDARFGTRDDAMSRLSVLQERQIDLIQQIARSSRVGENDNAHAQRAAQAQTQIAELRGGRAQTAAAEARLLADKEESSGRANEEYRREQALRRTMAEQDAYSRTPEGRAEARRNSIRGLRQDAFGGRERSMVGAEAALADLRDPAAQAEAAQQRALESQVERERAQTEERLRVQESFTEQWERLHRRQASATTAATDAANSAITSFGQAFGKHVNLILDGEEDVGEAALNMVQEVVTAIGQEAIVKSAMELAEGIAAAAGVLTAPLAPGHFAASAAFAAVGVAALGAGALVSAARGGGGGAAGAPVTPALPPPTQQDAAAAEGGRNISIVYGSGILGSTRDLARHIRDTMEEGAQGGIMLPARVVERAA